MTLEIMSFSKLQEQPNVFIEPLFGGAFDKETGERVTEILSVFAEAEWPEHHLPLVSGAGYKPEAYSQFTFGTVDSYNRWRKELAHIVGYTPENPARQPFQELLNFTDQYGLIGPLYCKKLYEDFKEYNNLAGQESEQFYKNYRLFMKAFEMGKDDGAVLLT